MDREGILEILKKGNLKEIFNRANEMRKLYCGEKVYIRGIIEFSNYCVRNCLYCGLRRDAFTIGSI